MMYAMASKLQICTATTVQCYPSTGIERVNFYLPGTLRSPTCLVSSAIDGRVKVWDFEQKQCVATQTESTSPIWNAKWLRTSDGFITGGADKSLYWYIAAGV